MVPLPSLLNAATQSVRICSLGFADSPHIEALPGAAPEPVPVAVELLQPTTETAAMPAPAARNPRREKADREKADRCVILDSPEVAARTPRASQQTHHNPVCMEEQRFGFRSTPDRYFGVAELLAEEFSSSASTNAPPRRGGRGGSQSMAGGQSSRPGQAATYLSIWTMSPYWGLMPRHLMRPWRVGRLVKATGRNARWASSSEQNRPTWRRTSESCSTGHGFPAYAMNEVLMGVHLLQRGLVGRQSTSGPR